MSKSHLSRRAVEAVKNNDLKKLESLLEMGVDPNGTDSPLLLLAAWDGNHTLVPSLVKYGADIEVNADGWTPLSFAVARADAKMIETLLKHGANPNGRHKTSLVLIEAVRSRLSRCVRLLLTAGADPTALNGAGECALSVSEIHKDRTIVDMLAETVAQKESEDLKGELADVSRSSKQKRL